MVLQTVHHEMSNECGNFGKVNMGVCVLECTSNACNGGLGDRILFKSKAILNIICTHALQSLQRHAKNKALIIIAMSEGGYLLNPVH
jgi:hypothetical protein